LALLQLRKFLRQKTVTAETISMSISVYLLMGITWGLLYVVIYERHPHFQLRRSASGADGTRYFSDPHLLQLTTISTIGFGDITPMTMQTRFAAVAEGITGQFYLAIWLRGWLESI
jgi:hypothetical protein